MSIDPSRLYTALLNTGLQRKDNALYQVIHDLIKTVTSINIQINPINPVPSPTPIITNVTQLLGSFLDNNGEDTLISIPSEQFWRRSNTGIYYLDGNISISSENVSNFINFTSVSVRQLTTPTRGGIGFIADGGIRIENSLATLRGDFSYNGMDLQDLDLSVVGNGSGILFLANVAHTSFDRIQFGGVTISFPALKRNGAALEAKFADNSGYSSFGAAKYYFEGVTSSFPMFKRTGAGINCRLADDSSDAELSCNNLTVANGGAIIGTSRGRWTFGSDGQLAIQNNAGTNTASLVAGQGLDIGSNLRVIQNGDGVLFFSNVAQTAVNPRIQFGGTSNSFPAIRRSSTTIQIRLADESGDAPLSALSGKFSSLTSGKIPIASTGGLLIDSTSSLSVAAGTPQIVASTFEKAETGTDANVLTYTVGAADEFLVVQIAVDVSALTGTSVAATVTWKDSNNATQTSTVTLTGVADGNINIPINAFTTTNVVVSTVFVGVTTAYKISAFITRLK